MLKHILLVISISLASCSEDHTGYSCNSAANPNFSSDDCRQRLQTAQCRDGGVETRGSNNDGGFQQLCCVFESCFKSPYPELDGR